MAKVNGKNWGIGVVMGVTGIIILGGLILLLNMATPDAAEQPETAQTIEGAPAMNAAVGEAVPTPDLGATECNFSEWVGKTSSEAEAAAKATGRPYRILPPNSAMTMDFRADRINIETSGSDASATVTKVSCG